MLATALAHPGVLAAVRLADDDDSGESKKSGPIGLVVIILLCVACYFLFKSLSKHLRSVREGEVPVSAPPVPAPTVDGPTASLGPVASGPVAPVRVEAEGKATPPPTP